MGTKTRLGRILEGHGHGLSLLLGLFPLSQHWRGVQDKIINWLFSGENKSSEQFCIVVIMSALHLVWAAYVREYYTQKKK